MLDRMSDDATKSKFPISMPFTSPDADKVGHLWSDLELRVLQQF